MIVIKLPTKPEVRALVARLVQAERLRRQPDRLSQILSRKPQSRAGHSGQKPRSLASLLRHPGPFADVPDSEAPKSLGAWLLRSAHPKDPSASPLPFPPWKRAARGRVNLSAAHQIVARGYGNHY